MIQCEPLQRGHLAGVISLCEAEGWASYTEDSETTWQALTAQGVCTVVAAEGAAVLGFAQVQSDGHIQAHLSVMVVARGSRRRGIGRRLVEEAFALSGAKRLDLVTDSADDFYQSFNHRRLHGYRIYPSGMNAVKQG